MKKVKITRVVSRAQMHDFDGYAIRSADGELDRFYPARIREPKTIGYDSVVEISEEFFQYIAILQSQGVDVVFKH